MKVKTGQDVLLLPEGDNPHNLPPYAAKVVCDREFVRNADDVVIRARDSANRRDENGNPIREVGPFVSGDVTVVYWDDWGSQFVATVNPRRLAPVPTAEAPAPVVSAPVVSAPAENKEGE